jgi:predicted small lipoprotein YifL
MNKKIFLILASIQLVALLSGCGVKGLPLPPLPVTPQQADLQQNRTPQPITSPAPSPSPQREFE